MEIKYSEKSVKQLKKIAKGDLKSAEMIIKEIENYAGKTPGILTSNFLKENMVNLNVFESEIIE
ncbi:MAG: hypothetical protein KA015_04060 [Spirochaetes bacterium]|nr:hypothetical protein [Spirochaetota bacterium]